MSEHRLPHHPPLHGELHNVDTAHEHSDINIRAIVTFVIVLAVVTIVIQGAMVGMFKVLNMIEEKNDPPVSPLARSAAKDASDFPDPRLQTTPWMDLKQLRARETAHLQGYGWVDQQAGIARIPIDRAKALLLQKGIPVRPDLADPAEGTRVAVTGEASGGRNLPAGGADRSSPSAPAPPPAGAAPKKPGGGL
jgi:hypothetical protein